MLEEHRQVLLDVKDEEVNKFLDAVCQALNFVRNSRTLVEVGNFVGSGTIDFSPCRDLLAKGITLIGSFDNEAEHFVRSLPLIGSHGFFYFFIVSPAFTYYYL